MLLVALTPIALAQPGTVQAHQKISSTEGGFAGVLDDDLFGYATASLGDLDGDGVADLAVGAPEDDDGGSNRGAVWILFSQADGTVKGHQKISSSTVGGLDGDLGTGDRFGSALVSLGDVDDDGVTDLAVGTYLDDDGGTNRGAVYVLFLNADGTVKGHQKISSTAGGLSDLLDNDDNFGASVAALGDGDGDGVPDLAVGAPGDDDGGDGRGAVYVLRLSADGSVKDEQKISDAEGDLTGALSDGDGFGASVASPGDFDGDGTPDLAVGADLDDDGGTDRGAVWILLLDPDGTVNVDRKISSAAGNFTGTLDDDDQFGVAVAFLGDLDGDGVADLGVGATEDDDGSTNRGAVWVLRLNADGTVKNHRKISSTEGGFTGDLASADRFGASLAALGDLDGDGAVDLAAGAIGDDDGDLNHGAVWVLFLDGAVEVEPQDGLGNPLPEPVFVPGARTEIFYAGALWNPNDGVGGVLRAAGAGSTSSLTTTLDGWPVITFPDGSQIVRRRPTVYVIEGASAAYAGAFNMLASFEPGPYEFAYHMGDHPSDTWARSTFALFKGRPQRTGGSVRLVGEPVAMQAQAALAEAGDPDWVAVAPDTSVEAAFAVAGATRHAHRPLSSGAVLGASYPNPFNPAATVPFTVAEAGPVRLAVYDVLGREVARLADGFTEAGNHTAVFDASALPSGTYLVRLTAPGGFVHTQRLTLLK